MSNMKYAGAISYEEGVNLIAESEIHTCVDMGGAFLYKLVHPTHGSIAVVNSSMGMSGFMPL